MGAYESVPGVRRRSPSSTTSCGLGGSGSSLAPDGMVRLNPGLIRIPDVSFISADRLPGRRMPREAICPIIPDLAIEVLSKSNTRKEMDEKLADYFAAGVRLVWYIDPDTQTARAFTADRSSSGPHDRPAPRRRRRAAGLRPAAPRAVRRPSRGRCGPGRPRPRLDRAARSRRLAGRLAVADTLDGPARSNSPSGPAEPAMPSTTRKPDNDYHLVLFDAPDDPKAVRDLICGVTGLHPTDAMQWVARAPGVWRRPLPEGEVRELLDGLFELGVPAEAWRVDQLPNLVPPADDPRGRLPGGRPADQRPAGRGGPLGPLEQAGAGRRRPDRPGGRVPRRRRRPAGSRPSRPA